MGLCTSCPRKAFKGGLCWVSDTSGIENPVDQWNRLECRCKETQITVWLNGHRVNAARHVHPHDGQILLQCEGSEIFFRRVELLPLTETIESIDRQ